MKIIEVQNLCKNYKEIQAVKGINFSIKKGEFVALLGPNGAGKSTTINILSTLLRQTSGTVMYQNDQIGRDDDSIRKKIGIVFQESVLDDKLTVKENLETRAILYSNDIQTTKSIVSSTIDLLKLEEIQNQLYGELSGGQKRRVDIARALLHSPEILFLDEPTTGLDPSTRKLVWETLTALRNNGLTIILTTHYMEETMNCDSIIVIDQGNIIAHDTPEKLRFLYSSDVLKVMGELDKIKSLIGEYENKLYNDYIEIKLANSKEAIELLNTLNPYIEAFEVIRGNMDDVFLQLTGRRLNE